MSATSRLAVGLARGHRVAPRAAGYVHTAMFVNTRGLGNVPDDLCPLGARRIAVAGVPRVAAVYCWGTGEPTVLALHGWGADSTTMATVVDVAVAGGESALSFDAPGHGVSPGSHATIAEYADATHQVLQRFPTVRTIVAHSLASIAAVAAVARTDPAQVRHLLLLAPACSLSGVLERWVAQRGLPRRMVALISRELERRDGVALSHWDIRTLGVPASVRVRILHDPTDEAVPLRDAHLIAADVAAQLHECAPGTGHHAILGCPEMRSSLTECLRTGSDAPGAGHG